MGSTESRPTDLDSIGCYRAVTTHLSIRVHSVIRGRSTKKPGGKNEFSSRVEFVSESRESGTVNQRAGVNASFSSLSFS